MRTVLRSILLSLPLTFPFLSVGCSSIRSPRFEAVGVREIEHTQTRTVYAFAIKATNPNKEPIPLREVSYTVTLDGVHSFSGVRSPETTLHTYAEHVFELPAVFEFAREDMTGIVDYRIDGSTKYLKPGKLNEVLFDSKISVPKAEFTLRGQVDVDAPDR